MSNSENCKVEMGENGLHLTNGIVTVSYDARLGYISMLSADGNKTCFSSGYILVHTDRETYDSRKLIYKSFTALEFQEEHLSGRAVVLRLQDMDKTAEFNIRISIYEKLPGFSIIVQFRNRSDETSLKTIDVLVVDVDDNSRIVTGWNRNNLRFFKNGFHSWELSQAVPIDVGENLSHFYSVLRNVESSESLTLGFVTMADQFSTIAVHGREPENSRLSLVVATSHADGVPVTEKDAIVSEELLILYGKDARRNLEQYLDFVSVRMNALKWANIPAGWCSWYFYYTMPDEGEIIENTEFLAKRFGNQLEWIQIDDGYQMRVGDWGENNRFAGGLASLVKDIHEKGYKAGVWTAPFVASEHSDIFKDKVEWFVRDAQNIPTVVGENPLWLGNYYALDLTNPQVIKHIKKVFRNLKNDGFEYFKIDFLYHAAQLGQRYDSKITRAQAIRQGLEAIREVVGDDLILGCGAPLGPCVGIVNMMRIGTDIGTNWRYEWGGGVYECSVNTMTRAAMHGRWWINDPDCVLVRQNDNELTENEVKLWLSIVALSGGAVLMSDRMVEVSEERLSLLDKILPSYGEGAIAVDALENANPTVFALTVETQSGSWLVVAAVNLNESPIDVNISFESVGLDSEHKYHVFDFWQERYLGLVEKQVGVAGLEPHTLKLLLVKPESSEPTVLSTSMHYTQGAVELADIDWNSGSNELSLRVTRDTRHEECIFFVFNEEWIPSRAYVEDEMVSFVEIAPEVVAVKRRFTNGQTIRLKFTQ
jgi:alpha-galactosidase